MALCVTDHSDANIMKEDIIVSFFLFRSWRVDYIHWWWWQVRLGLFGIMSTSYYLPESTTWWLVVRTRRNTCCVFVVDHAQLQTHRVLISHRVLRWEVIRATVQLQAHVTSTALHCSQQRTLIHGHIRLHCTHNITEMNFLYRDEQSIHSGCKADMQCSLFTMQVLLN